MRKVLKKNIILYKPLFQVIIAQSAAGKAVRDFPRLGCIPGSYRNAGGQILCFARNAGGQILFPTPLLPPARTLPAIHRGHQSLSQLSESNVRAHGATNLFRRGQYPLQGSTLGWGGAHCELQERKVILTLPS